MKKKINYNIIFYIVMVTLIFCKSNENEFIGKIFNSRNNNIISFEKLINQMKNMDVIYLGEKHDNTEHHQYQIDIIQSLISEGISPIIGFEFFYQHQTSDLMKYVKGIKSPFQHEEENLAKDEEQLREKLGWQNKKDEDWSFYFDLIKLAKDNDLTVFGSDLPSGIVSRISREGLDSLTPVELNQIFSSNFNDNNYQQLMVKKFKESHCGWVPKDDFEKLYHTWVARNDAMAISIVKMLELNQPVVMIVGGGHVEHNMGIYDRVEYFNSKLNQLNLGFKEISIEKSSLSDYFESPVIHGFKYLPKHEYFWFTNRKADKDPCEGFNF